MAKPDKESPPEAAGWGTWEELLLAYAVNRFGTNSWDSISSELRKRSSAQILLTPHHCKQKYQELERRFTKCNGDDVDIDDGSGTGTTDSVPWIEELRKLRVAELKRQLENFDIYISSLKSKVKKLTEESEKNGCGETKKKPDLGQKNDEIETENEEGVKYNSPDAVVSGEEQVPIGEESDRDNQSVNGSNGNLETGADKSENENESNPVGTGDQKPESSPNSPIRVDDSFNGGPVVSEPVKNDPDVAESKSEGTVRENSDVQSAASKSIKGRSDRVRRGTSKAEELDNDDESKDSIPVRSLPLVDILQKVRKLGSAVFERRLDRQEKLRYKNMIKQHVDFEILQTRLKEGLYSDGNNKFFRDLLLLVNNTRVFFPYESPECVAATDLREFVLNEMLSKRRQKTKLAGPIIVCRKRSSIATKKASVSENSDDKSDVKKKNKQSAAKFLNRMKQSLSPAKKDPVDPAAGGGSENGGSERKNGGDGKGDQVSKRRQPKEPDSPVKRSVGRPPKRAAAAAAAQTPIAAALGKRSRECVESETSISKQKKKRSKR